MIDRGKVHNPADAGEQSLSTSRDILVFGSKFGWDAEGEGEGRHGEVACICLMQISAEGIVTEGDLAKARLSIPQFQSTTNKPLHSETLPMARHPWPQHQSQRQRQGRPLQERTGAHATLHPPRFRPSTSTTIPQPPARCMCPGSANDGAHRTVQVLFALDTLAIRIGSASPAKIGKFPDKFRIAIQLIPSGLETRFLSESVPPAVNVPLLVSFVSSNRRLRTPGA
ncbi:hypothetical protein C8F04DRAFT_1184168 [Mycena alexandri]|uniref:Uncharacterized protein n=1 Tax=Mycena alexandri TaxID=1745969 RepID=A0AAD6SUT0_9AGAR|nr:hypothetical protein C8F04DRAFT_1184168 [Mycena alexandri]